MTSTNLAFKILILLGFLGLSEAAAALDVAVEAGAYRGLVGGVAHDFAGLSAALPLGADVEAQAGARWEFGAVKPKPSIGGYARIAAGEQILAFDAPLLGPVAWRVGLAPGFFYTRTDDTSERTDPFQAGDIYRGMAEEDGKRHFAFGLTTALLDFRAGNYRASFCEWEWRSRLGHEFGMRVDLGLTFVRAGVRL